MTNDEDDTFEILKRFPVSRKIEDAIRNFYRVKSSTNGKIIQDAINSINDSLRDENHEFKHRLITDEFGNEIYEVYSTTTNENLIRYTVSTHHITTRKSTFSNIVYARKGDTFNPEISVAGGKIIVRGVIRSRVK